MDKKLISGRQELRIIAIFLITLIITLPFYTASVFAAPAIVGVDSALTGKDGKSYERRATDDFWDMAVRVFVDTENTTAEQVPMMLTLYDNEQFRNFASCKSAESANTYICNFHSDEDFTPGAFTRTDGNPYIIQLNAPGCSSGCARDIQSVFVDGQAPVISNLKFETEPFNNEIFLSGNEALISYTVTDRVAPSSDKCTGIDRVEFYNKLNSQLLTTRNIKSSGCTFTETASVPTSSFPEGPNSLCVAAYDIVENGARDGRYCYDINIKKEGPVITSFTITNEKGIPISYASSKGITAYLKAKIISKDVGIKSANLDLTAIGGLPTHPMSCTGDENFTCTASIVLYPFEESKDITLTVADQVGNQATQTKTISVLRDDDTPILVEMSTQGKFDNKNYVKASNNTFIARFDETGSGLATASLNFGGKLIGSSGMDAIAGNCSGTTCRWDGISLANEKSNNQKIGFTIRFSDAAGNAGLAQNYAIITDTEKPKIDEVILRTIDSPYLLVGEPLIVTAYITDNAAISDSSESPTKFFANLDLSKLIKDYGAFGALEAESCAYNGTLESGGTRWACTWNVQEALPSTNKLMLGFNYTDIAGNEQQEEIDKFRILWNDGIMDRLTPESNMPILEAGNVTKDNFDIKVTGGPSPPFIDQQILQTTAAGFPINFELGLERKAGELVRLEFLGCDANGTTQFSELVEYAKLVQPYALGVNGTDYNIPKYMVFNTYSGGIAVEDGTELKFPCAYRLTTRSNGKLFKEVEELNFAIPIHNNPLGTYDKTLITGIKDFQKDIGDWGKTINKLEAWIEGATKLCNAINLVFSVVQAISSLFTLFGTECDTATGATLGIGSSCYPIQAALQTGTAGAMANTANTFGKIYKWTCGVVTCSTNLLGEIYDAQSKKGNELIKTYDPTKTQSIQQRAAIPGSSTSYTLTHLDSVYGSRWWASQALLDPKGSFIGAAIRLCIPGIIYNMHKALTIKCDYINCLKETKNMIPPYTCSKQYQTESCKYVSGQFTALIPGLFNQIMQLIALFFTQDAKAIIIATTSIAVGYACPPVCKATGTSGGAACTACMTARYAKMWVDLSCALLPIGENCGTAWDTFKDVDKLPSNRCEEALKPIEGIEESAQEITPQTAQ